MPRRSRQLLIALLACGCLWARDSAGSTAQVQVAVITAEPAPQLTLDRDTLRNVYLKKIFVDRKGQRLVPVNLPPESALRVAFIHTVIHLPDGQLEDYWNRQYFQGVSPPYVLASQQAVVRFVAATPGAVGYVATCHVDSSVRVVLMLTLPVPGTPAAVADCPRQPPH